VHGVASILYPKKKKDSLQNVNTENIGWACSNTMDYDSNVFRSNFENIQMIEDPLPSTEMFLEKLKISSAEGKKDLL